MNSELQIPSCTRDSLSVACLVPAPISVAANKIIWFYLLVFRG